MRKPLFLFSIVIATASFVGCNNSSNDDQSNIDDTTTPEVSMGSENVTTDIDESYDSLKATSDEQLNKSSELAFNPNSYYDLSTPQGSEMIRKVYLKLAAETLSDEDFAKAHNIEGIFSDNSFEQQAAKDKVAEFKDNAMRSEVPSDLKFKASFARQDMMIPFLKQGVISGDAWGTLTGYDFEKTSFQYNPNSDTCAISRTVEVPMKSEENSIKTESILTAGLEGISIPLNNEALEAPSVDTYPSYCYLEVADKEIASNIENARLDKKVRMVGYDYFTVESVDWSERKGPIIKVKKDAEDISLHIMNDNEALSEPLGFKRIIRK